MPNHHREPLALTTVPLRQSWIGLGQIRYRVGSEFSQYIMGCVGLGYVA